MKKNDYLAHHGIKGQKWGIRRYQNPDGTRTPEGIERYKLDSYKMHKRSLAPIIGDFKDMKNAKEDRKNMTDQVNKIYNEESRKINREYDKKVDDYVKKNGYESYEAFIDQADGEIYDKYKKMVNDHNLASMKLTDSKYKAIDSINYRIKENYKKFY